jgi:hypothetical protein
MNKKRASQSARIQELEQHIVKIYMLLEQVVEQLKGRDEQGTTKT